MKTYKFQANCRTKESAVDFAKEFLRDFGEDPKEFEIKAKQTFYNTFEIIAKRKDVQ